MATAKISQVGSLRSITSGDLIETENGAGVSGHSALGVMASKDSVAVGDLPNSIRTTYPNCDLLTGSGNWPVPAGITRVYVVVVGGGGGGGGIATGVAATATSGQPGYVNTGLIAVTPAATIAYAQGAAGTGGAAGNNPGVAGGDSSFGAIIAKGGIGGNGSASGNASVPTTTAGRIAQLNAMSVVPTASVIATPFHSAPNPAAGSAGVGGTAFPTNSFGINGAGGSSAAGAAATGYGQAGGGAGHTLSVSDLAGGDGSPGVILVFY